MITPTFLSRAVSLGILAEETEPVPLMDLMERFRPHAWSFIDISHSRDEWGWICGPTAALSVLVVGCWKMIARSIERGTTGLGVPLMASDMPDLALAGGVGLVMGFVLFYPVLASRNLAFLMLREQSRRVPTQHLLEWAQTHYAHCPSTLRYIQNLFFARQ